jgi:hypothetical protein
MPLPKSGMSTSNSEYGEQTSSGDGLNELADAFTALMEDPSP